LPLQQHSWYDQGALPIGIYEYEMGGEDQNDIIHHIKPHKMVKFIVIKPHKMAKLI